MSTDVLSLDRSKLDLIGQLVEVRWAIAHPFAKKQCEKCVYAVRGLEYDMICLDLVYDAEDGVHRTGSIHWVNVLAVQYLRVLSEREVKTRIESVEREFELAHPRD